MENIEILALDQLKPTFSGQKQFHYHCPSIRESVRNIAVLWYIFSCIIKFCNTGWLGSVFYFLHRALMSSSLMSLYYTFFIRTSKILIRFSFFNFWRFSVWKYSYFDLIFYGRILPAHGNFTCSRLHLMLIIRSNWGYGDKNIWKLLLKSIKLYTRWNILLHHKS